MKKSMTALALTSAFIFLLAACGAATPTPTPPTATPPPTDAPTATAAAPDTTAPQASNICGQGEMPVFIQDIILTTNTTGANFDPADHVQEFAPTQATFHAVVSLKNAPANLKLRVAWYLLQAEGYKANTKIDENELSVGDGGTRNVDFTLKSKESNWPPGSYCVEIYSDGKLAASKNFKVKGSSAPSNATSDIVKQIVLAEDVKPNTYEPINPTTKFRTNAPLIHLAVQIEQAPVNTAFRARWYPPNQDPLDFDLTTDGTRWLDFHLTPGANGFPSGEYKVELYVSEKLVDTKTFTVQ